MLELQGLRLRSPVKQVKNFLIVRQHHVKGAADGAGAAQGLAGHHGLVVAVESDKVGIQVQDALHLEQVVVGLLHPQDGPAAEQLHVGRVADGKLLVGVAREIVDEHRSAGGLSDVVVVLADLPGGEAVIKGGGGGGKVKAHGHGGPGIAHRLIGGNGPHVGNQVCLPRKGGGGPEDLQALLFGEQEALPAAAPDEEAGGPLLPVALHYPLESGSVDAARPVIGGDAGGVNTPQLFFCFHVSFPSFPAKLGILYHRAGRCANFLLDKARFFR